MSSLRSIQRGTQRVSAPRPRPPLRIVADDATLTPYGGGAVVGELCRGLGLVAGLDRAIGGGLWCIAVGHQLGWDGVHR
ncbi:MAG: hypothetical protein K2X91_00625, partial [Thermoleophilia bacterium]|nr:hypothetical protein [Thermoleophilia bacterium]